jgi:hypothetical protein
VSRRLIGFACDIKDGRDDLLVVPAGRKLGFARLADSMSVAAAATDRVPVEYVPAAFGADAQRVQHRAVRRVYRVPTGTVWLYVAVEIVALLPSSAVSRAECLVVLLVGPRLGWLRVCRGDVAALSAITKMLLGTGVTHPEVVIRPV